jgi:putative SOS response-associated peptidase YedK
MSKATSDLLSHSEAKDIEGESARAELECGPHSEVPIVAERLDDGTLDGRLLVARWGLIPCWAKDAKIGSKLLCIN